jgi:tetratricopeptide (TPR) repeat protein
LLAACLAFGAPDAFAQSDAPGAPDAGELLDRLQRGDEPDESVPKTQERVDEPGPDEADERLDRLFERLAQAETKPRADRIAANIQRRLLRSGSPTIDLLMSQAAKAIEKNEYGAALDVLDAVVRLKPDYAEGWNRRATVYFVREEFGASLADIERVLQLEPRHWGALSGRARILVPIARNEDALEAIESALAIPPPLEELQEQRE